MTNLPNMSHHGIVNNAPGPAAGLLNNNATGQSSAPSAIYPVPAVQHSHVNPSPAALSTAAAVAAISGTFQPMQYTNVSSTAGAPAPIYPSVILQQNQQQQQHGNAHVPVAQTINHSVPNHPGAPQCTMPQHPPSTSSTVAQNSLFFNTVNPVQQMPSYRPRTVKTSTPSVFANMSLRRGKWTAEEERFANSLIEEFEKGSILDCENGCTLRAYLSRKLHCAPMRISKKYAGKSIGKHVFLSRIPSLSGRAVAQENYEKLKQLEFQFHMSLIQEGAASSALGQNMSKIPNIGQPSVLASTSCTADANTSVNYAMLLQSQQLNCTNNTSQMQAPNMVNLNVSQLMNNPNLQTNACPMPAPAAFSTWGGSAPAPVPPSGGPIVPAPSGLSATMQMQQNLFNAFKDAQTSSSTTSAQPSTQQPARVLVQDTTTAVPSYNPTKIQMPGSLNVEVKNVASNPTNNNALPVSSDIKSNDASINDDIPELLSGFDKVNNNNKAKSQTEDQNSSQAQQNWLSETMNIIPTLDPSSYMGQFSPTYTSKSFDDLHQFIGKDCPPLLKLNGDTKDSSGNNSAVTTSLSTSEYHLSDLAAADAYALFAQQSALAVSKHSAYCRNNASETESTSTFRSSQVQQPQQVPVVNSLLLPYEIPPLQQQTNNTAVYNAGDPTSNCGQNTNSSQPQLSSTIEIPIKAERVSVNNSAAFNATNLQLHSEAVEERARADHAAISRETSGSTRSIVDTTATPVATTEFNTSVLRMNANIVSGSEESSTSAGGSSRVCSSGSAGSDNLSDNSDSASDEGQVHAGNKRKARDEKIPSMTGMHGEKKIKNTGIPTKREAS